MGLDTKEVLDVILEHLSEEEIEDSIISWDRKLLEQGDSVKVGRESIEMPFDGYMAFVDLVPKANWGHPCLYFLIDAEADRVQVRKEVFPPYYGKYPESYIVIQRYGEEPPHDRYFQAFDTD
jgi:hypothetical protein